MTFELAEKMAIDLLSQHGLGDWKVRLTRRIHKIGNCDYESKTIELSKPFIQNNMDDEIKDTILHEIAHALTPGTGHGKEWKAMACTLGASPSSHKAVVMPKGMIVSICKECGALYRRHRRPSSPRYCRFCYEKEKFSRALEWTKYTSRK